MTCNIYRGQIHVECESEESSAEYKVRKFTLTREDEEVVVMFVVHMFVDWLAGSNDCLFLFKCAVLSC